MHSSKCEPARALPTSTPIGSLLLVAMTFAAGACPSIKADAERLVEIGPRPLYRVTCPGVYDCSIKIGALCKHGNYRWYQCHKDPVTILAVCANESDNVTFGHGPALESLSRCDRDAVNESMATEETRRLDLWSAENLRRMRTARGTQLRAERKRLGEIDGRPLFSATCYDAMSVDCVLDLAEACDYQGYRWYQCQKSPVKMVALCRKDGDKHGNREAGVEPITACTPQAVEAALKSPPGATRP